MKTITKNMPIISIVLPVFNGETYLSESIESIISQSFNDWELIIVDDCSTDSTPQIISRYKAADKRIRFIRNEENKRLPESLNIGFRNAYGEYYTWTSDDNIFEVEALSEMKNFLDSHKDAPMVVANMACIDAIGERINDRGIFRNEKMALNNYVGACFLYRADVAKRVGEYNNNLFLIEDYDYWLRIIELFGPLSHLDKYLYRYRVHKNSLTGKRLSDIRKKLNELRRSKLELLINISNGEQEWIVRLFC